MPSHQIENKFCVIAPQVTGHGYSRTWKRTAEDAAAHAVALLQKDHQKATEFYVVEVVKVVRTSLVPVEILDVE